LDASSVKTYVVVGLGNPGKKYELTRHNIGFLVLNEWALKQGWSFKENKEFNAKVAKGVIGQNQVHLIMPQTYMNESGNAVRRYLDFYKIPPKHLLVISDDVALPYGQIRLRRMGSSGGHNGLKSIEAHIGTRHYDRMRMGIDRQLDGRMLADYVLDNFSPEELTGLADFVQRGVEIVERLMSEGIADVMNSINAKVPKI